MNRTAQDLAAAAAGLAQLVTVALLAARRGHRDHAERVVAILRGHGEDGAYALLYGVTDALLGRTPGELPKPMQPTVSIGAFLTGEQPDAAAWCVRFLLARACVDPAECRALISDPPPGGLFPVMCLLTDLAARAINQIEGDPA